MARSRLKPAERLLLWQLATAPDGLLNKDLGSYVKSRSVRLSLARKKLIDVQREGRTFRLRIADPGWDWCQDNLRSGIEARTQETAVVLDRVLATIADFCERSEEAPKFGFFIQIARSSDTTSDHETDDHETDDNDAASGDEQAVFDACLALAGEAHRSVRIADVRDRLPEMNGTLDETLQALHKRGVLSLSPHEDPRDRTRRDEEAALTMPSGDTHHLVAIRRALDGST